MDDKKSRYQMPVLLGYTINRRLAVLPTVFYEYNRFYGAELALNWRRTGVGMA